VSNYRDSASFGGLCDAVAERRLVAVTGSGVSAGLASASAPLATLPTWHSVLERLRERFETRLTCIEPELKVLLEAHIWDSAYLIEAATLIRHVVGAAEFQRAVVELTTPAAGAYSALHGLIEALEPLGIVTFNYDMGHENAYRAAHAGAASKLKRAIYSDETKLREILAGDFESRFLLKAHGSITRAGTVVLDRQSYREIMGRQPGYRAFLHHVLMRFNALIVGFGLTDPDFDDVLETFADSFGGGVRDHIYIWKRGQRADEQARAIVLQRRYGLACIFVDSFEDVQSLIGDASREIGPRLRKTIEGALRRSEDVSAFREERRTAHIALGELSAAGAATATTVLRGQAEDAALPPSVRAEAVYSLGKVRPTLDGTAEFLLERVTAESDPEIATYALAALLQLEPPVDRRIESWTRAAAARWSACDSIDQRIALCGVRGGRPRARKYLEALLARWNATRSDPPKS
jgi:hypothetical protein